MIWAAVDWSFLYLRGIHLYLIVLILRKGLMPLAPNLVAFVMDAPVEAVLGWSVLTDRLLGVLRSALTVG